MRILLVHPNYQSGAAEVAGKWPPAWVPYLAGPLKAAGFTDIQFIDGATDELSEEQIRARIREANPDVIGSTAKTASIYKAERVLEIGKEEFPDSVSIIGGIHPTFMYRQVLNEAPWIDVVVRGEGEDIFVDLMQTIAEGRWPEDRHSVKGIAFHDGEDVKTTPAAPPIKDLDRIKPDWSVLDWEKYIYIPTNTRVAVPNFARGCPYTCNFCSQWMFWRTYRLRSPKEVVDEIEQLVNEHNIGFFILADEEPTIHGEKFVEFCQELKDRNLPVQWGINTRVNDVLRDEELLPFYREAGLIHVSLGTEAAAQMNLDFFRKETTVAENKKAVQLLQQNGIVTEAQFIVGMENETPETLEETYQMVMDWNPDMANWSMYTPWPYSDLFKEMGDKVEIFDFDKYNFVTPIIKPDNMTRDQLLDRVMHNYRRFYMRKTFLGYPWVRDPRRRKYLLNCLKAYLKAAFQRKFYRLGKVGYWGPGSNVDFGFDETKNTIDQPEIGEWKSAPPSKLRQLKAKTSQSESETEVPREAAE